MESNNAHCGIERSRIIRTQYKLESLDAFKSIQVFIDTNKKHEDNYEVTYFVAENRLLMLFTYSRTTNKI